TSKPTSLRGYFKYTPSGSDSCVIGIGFSRFTTQTDTIGEGFMKSGLVSSWTLFEIPIEYTSPDAPDSMNILVMSSNVDSYVDGSTLLLDSLTLVYSSTGTGIETVSFSPTVYPNPAHNCVMISSDRPASVRIFNSIGSTVLTSSKTGNGHKPWKLDISCIPKGIYLVEIDSGKEKVVRKLSVQ
ncbi:MAG: T9SS type A sorting domain-containing protein, partial [Bacteroidetes bacterium]|nr:T9SS type A sorting domain-containing protein [Bacteroidota bacterium]